MPDGSLMNFPTSLQLPFNFRSAFGTIQQVLYGADCDLDYLHAGLRSLGAEPVDGAVPGGS